MWAGSKTVIIIAHRMRTVSGADKTVVLSDGTVKESGNPGDLLKQGGIGNTAEDNLFKDWSFIVIRSKVREGETHGLFYHYKTLVLRYVKRGLRYFWSFSIINMIPLCFLGLFQKYNDLMCNKRHNRKNKN